MSSTLVGGTKGGIGKSTTVCHLAVMRALAGRRVCVFDLDKQRSAHRFVQTRNGLGITPALRSVSAFIDIKPGEDPVPMGRALISDLRSVTKEFDDVLIDVGGEDNPALRFAMLAADRMLVPLAPAQFDIWALADLTKVLGDVMSSRTDDFRPTVFPCLMSPLTGEREAYQMVRDNYPVFSWAGPGVGISVRAAFRRSIANGQGLFDQPRMDVRARSELLGVYEMAFGEPWKRMKEAA